VWHCAVAQINTSPRVSHYKRPQTTKKITCGHGRRDSSLPSSQSSFQRQDRGVAGARGVRTSPCSSSARSHIKRTRLVPRKSDLSCTSPRREVEQLPQWLKHLSSPNVVRARVDECVCARARACVCVRRAILMGRRDEVNIEPTHCCQRRQSFLS
jgi:hypothetical protein